MNIEIQTKAKPGAIFHFDCKVHGRSDGSNAVKLGFGLTISDAPAPSVKQPARFDQRRVQTFRTDAAGKALHHFLFREIQHPVLIALVPDIGKRRANRIDHGVGIMVLAEHLCIKFRIEENEVVACCENTERFR